MNYSSEARHSHALTAEVARLARQHAPILLCDAREPFRPQTIGITRLTAGEQSPSCRHTPPAPEGTVHVLEYAIWWDGDIQHLYELEHVWVALNADGVALGVCASAHGGLFDMSQAAREDGRVVLYCEPGKHAHSADAAAILARRQALDHACQSGEDLRGIMINDMFCDALAFLSPYDQFLGRAYLKSLCFAPTYDFSLRFDLAQMRFASWSELANHVPVFIRDQLEQLRASRKGVKAVFLDSGATLIDEASQVFCQAEADLVLSAAALDGGDRLVGELKARGYVVALVADGREQSFRNVHSALGFWDLFDARAISEVCGVAKPEPLIFRDAMLKLGLRDEDAAGIVMFGNNIKRDIRGANALGLTSVWIDRQDGYDKSLVCAEDKPDFVVHAPLELLSVIDRIEAAAGNAG
ncbi:HAD family hydrolase [Rhizobium sp. SL86]|uniref:HAD family hydrolase n=1 Tax=Rhizobium sp. SL86 TaxID=2995148 RepID=UPI002273148D|nr:HAD family hydrolase [Rhizobium sp. SL86]MCY1666679.1 HAD family hydrolase [Rhizobium sp. SL86]